MHGKVRPAPQSEQSLATTRTKRKHSPIICQSESYIKRQRVISKTETLTLISDKDPILPSSSNFRSPRCSYRTEKRQKQKRNNEKSSSVSKEGHRRWANSSPDFSNCKDKVVVVSYNILGVENAAKHPDLYINVPSKYLDWDRRKKLIRREIRRYHPSVLCFQEVDRYDELDNLLQKDGFAGVYKARTGEACDGCAIFWEDRRFTLLHQENIEFRDFDLRDNVAQLCVLKMNREPSNADVNTHTSQSSSSRNLLVGNIHVLFNPNRGDIKLGQIRVFLEKAHKLSQEWGGIPIVLGGDLNSLPQSAIYKFLASSKLDLQLHDRRKISGQVERSLQCIAFKSRNKNPARCMSISKPLMYRWSDEELRLATGSVGVTHLQHHLKLCSAYFGVPGSCRTRDNTGEPSATSYHSSFMGTVDYIWHTEELVPVKVLETLPINILRSTKGLPSEKWGSDHLALVCELAFRDDGN